MSETNFTTSMASLQPQPTIVEQAYRAILDAICEGRLGLYDKIGDMKIRGPNDLVFDAHGGFYFTDPGKTRHRDWDRGSVCYAKADRSMIREIVFPIHKPNGIGLSPDGKTLYVAETESM